MGFLKWFKNSTKMKRWYLLILVGIALAVYGMVKLLTGTELQWHDLVVIIGSFVFGAVIVVISIIFIQKRTLELMVREADTREEVDAKSNVSSLIFNRKVYNEGPKVVVIGGGSGLNTVLRGLKNYTSNITAIVTLSDYGEPKSFSRKELESLPLDDLQQSLVALSQDEEAMERMINFKFTDGRLRGLDLGDVYLLGMSQCYGDLTKALEVTSKSILDVTGKVIPVTTDEISICAELEDGTVIEEKSKIAETVQERHSYIDRIYIDPTNVLPAPGVIEAIEEADAIVIGPGNLYTNVIPNLLVKGVSKAIKENKGFKIYIANIMTDLGQTDDYTLSDHIKAIIDHCGEGVIDYCIYDTGEIIPEFIRRYNEAGQEVIEQDIAKVKEYGVKLIQRNMSMIDGEMIRHNPDVLASTMIELICDDMKFRDMQNDYQFVMLENKLKSNKKDVKKFHKEKKKEFKKVRERGFADKPFEGGEDSKFAEKYKDRVQAIQKSDDKESERRKEELKKFSKEGKKKAKPEDLFKRLERARSHAEKMKAEEKRKNWRK